MAAITTFEQLLAFLDHNRIEYRADAPRLTVEVPSNATPLPGNLFVKWDAKLPVVQLVHFMIDDVPEERMGELEAAVARVNHRVESSGFGLDHERRRLYCRSTVPNYPPEGINPMTLNRIATGRVRGARELLEAFREVVGGKAGAEVLEIHRVIVQARRAAATSQPSPAVVEKR